MKVKKVIASFLDYTEEVRRPNTRRHYEGRLEAFRRMYGGRQLDEISTEDIDDYLAATNRFPDGKLKAPDTRRANAVVLQQLFAFAVRRGYLKKAPFEKLERPRSRRRERIPTDAENAAVEARAPLAFRRIFQALKQTGARPCELAAAEIGQFDREARLIILQEHKTVGSSGKPRKIGVGVKLEALLNEAIGDRTEGPIFLDARGRPWTTARMSATYRRLRKACGLSRELCLYLQRHKHATILCEKVGIHAAAMALGHASTVTTQRYIHPDDGLLAQYQDLV